MTMSNDAKLPVVIFLTSSASLAFEILLTRLFSISLWYHFAAMIISIAMLGFAASGTLLALYPCLKKVSYISLYCLLLGTAITASYLLSNRIPFDPVRLSWEKWELFHVAFYYLILAVPFFFAGLIIATSFAVVSSSAGLIYGADLLGAGAGSVGVLFLMALGPPESSVYILSSVALSAACFGGRRLRRAAFLLIMANLALLLSQPAFGKLRISPYKGLAAALRYPGAELLHTYFSPFVRIDTFKSPAVRFAPGLSLSYQAELPEQVGFSIDGGEVSAITAGSDQAAMDFLDHLPAALPYATGKRDSVLVLDPKGGMQVQMANHFDAIRVNSVETNAPLTEIIRNDFLEFTGGIYRENSWTGLGRSWLSGRRETFDLIDISLQGAEPTGSFGFAEDYRLTVEAFREYLEHLRKEGVISINLFIIPPPRTELRLLATLVAALEEMGLKDPSLHIAAVRSWGSICILAKKMPLSPAEIAAIKEFARKRQFDVMYAPGISAAETNIRIITHSTDYFSAFSALLSPELRQDFMAAYPFDINPARDERPFFHHFLRIGKVAEIYRTMGGKWQYFVEEGYILPAVFLQVLLISLVLVLLPALSGGKPEKLRAAGGCAILTYFAFLGIGYMFVEVSLIQKLILPMENPSIAVAATLTALLISSGVGSILGHRYKKLQGPCASAAIALMVVIYVMILPPLTGLLFPWPLPARFAFLFIIIAPLALLMGIPFPTGIKMLGDRAPQLIPWAWAINGALSVLAPLLAAMLAMKTGFSGVLLLGALVYFLAFLSLRLYKSELALLR